MFVGQKSIIRHCYIQNSKDGIQIRVYKINKESLTHFSQFILVKVKKIEAQVKCWLSYKKRVFYSVIKDSTFYIKSSISKHYFYPHSWITSLLMNTVTVKQASRTICKTALGITTRSN